MFLKNSRYLEALRFAARPDGTIPFKGVRAREIGVATGVVEHTMQPGERLDWLGTHYFNDSRRWWRVVDANPDVLCALELEMPGLQSPPGLSGDSNPDDVAAEAAQQGMAVLIPKAKE